MSDDDKIGEIMSGSAPRSIKKSDKDGGRVTSQPVTAASKTATKKSSAYHSK